MKSEEDILRLEEAKHCQGCPGWLKHCKAECCKTVKINIDPRTVPKTGKFLVVNHPGMTPGDRWYFGMRGIKTDRGKLRFPLEDVMIFGNEVVYVRSCEKLTDEGLCSGHPDNKPSICKELTLETAEMHIKADNGIYVTPNCLFRYKKKEGTKNAKEETN
jgi:hypothetical protein